MANFFKKYAKIIILIYGVLLFGTLISGLTYMTNLCHVHVYFNTDSNGDVDFKYDHTFELTEKDNKYLFKYFSYDKTQISEETKAEGVQLDPNANSDPQVPTFFEESGQAQIVYDFQMAMSQFNDQIITFAIVGLICFAVMLIFSNHSRQVYYKSNLYAGIAMPLVVIVYSVIMIIQNFNLMAIFNKHENLFRITYAMQHQNIGDNTKDVLMTNWNRLVEMTNEKGFSNVCYFIQFAVFVVVIVYSLLLMVYTIYRYNECAQRRKEIIERAVQE